MSPAIDPTALDRVLRDAVASGAVPHVAAIAADRGGVTYQGAAGPRTVGEAAPVTVDTLFRIMSMTKMPCTAAALQQAERGRLDLDAPVTRYCPEFAGVQVLAGFDRDAPVLRHPARQVTVRHLLTHTSGLGYWFWSEALVRWQAARTTHGLSGSAAFFAAPMVTEPGTAFVYGINTDWLGRVVEAVTGTGLDVVIKDGITGPLGMDQTTFWMDGGQRANCTPVHVRAADGSWTAIADAGDTEPEWWSGGHGLYAPPSDYIKLERALLRGGELDGTRILDPATVDAAFTNQIGGLDFPAGIPSADPRASGPLNLGPGYKWGYGLLLNTADIPGRRRAWSGAWTGLYNTHFWIDRTAGVCASLYSNCLPFITPEALGVYDDFERALYASL